MNSLKNLSLIIFVLTLTLTSCSKKDNQTQAKKEEIVKSKKELLTSKSWLISSIKENGVIIVMQDCSKDNTITFAANGTYSFNPGTNKCASYETIVTGTWTLSNDEKSLIVDGKDIITIVELTVVKFTYTFIDGTVLVEQTYLSF